MWGIQLCLRWFYLLMFQINHWWIFSYVLFVEFYYTFVFSSNYIFKLLEHVKQCLISEINSIRDIRWAPIIINHAFGCWGIGASYPLGLRVSCVWYSLSIYWNTTTKPYPSKEGKINYLPCLETAKYQITYMWNSIWTCEINRLIMSDLYCYSNLTDRKWSCGSE